MFGEMEEGKVMVYAQLVQLNQGLVNVEDISNATVGGSVRDVTVEVGGRESWKDSAEHVGSHARGRSKDRVVPAAQAQNDGLALRFTVSRREVNKVLTDIMKSER